MGFEALINSRIISTNFFLKNSQHFYPPKLKNKQVSSQNLFFPLLKKFRYMNF